ncbi:hypothetical protein JZ751_020129 [Albula glossodonta]|uniref:Uncharacterized protein n=1 Tax=Albula glossodonta TaxID=121402 RepID=A0A8T2NMR3_9TELE|nr:hypothetical protein JZ751_020129 [Albula glossodonta]
MRKESRKRERAQHLRICVAEEPPHAGDKEPPLSGEGDWRWATHYNERLLIRTVAIAILEEEL